MAVALAHLTKPSARASLSAIDKAPARAAAAPPIGRAKPDSAKRPPRKAFGSITW